MNFEVRIMGKIVNLQFNNKCDCKVIVNKFYTRLMPTLCIILLWGLLLFVSLYVNIMDKINIVNN